MIVAVLFPCRHWMLTGCCMLIGEAKINCKGAATVACDMTVAGRSACVG